MKFMIKIFAVAFSMMTLSSHAEVVTVNFKSTVSISMHTSIFAGEKVDISLTYDTDATYDGMNNYYDTSTGSNITATFESGLIVKTNPDALNKLDIFCTSVEVIPGLYEWKNHFYSYDAISNSTGSVTTLNLGFGTDVPVNQYSRLRTEWNEDISTFGIRALDIFIDGMWIHADITDMEYTPTVPESPVTVQVTTSSDPISSLGGKLYFTRDIQNTTDNTVKIKRWAYITWPDGTHYNHNRPKKLILDPMEQKIQTSAHFKVPAYWPAGTYEYQLNSIVVQGIDGKEGAVSKDTFTFTKATY